MTFAFPILLGGLLLAGAPLLLHLLIRRKPIPLLFPAFRFLLQKQRTNSRNLRLKHLILLLLRVALIVLVCLALARPRLYHEALGLSRERPVAMVLILDTSPSMDYKVGETTRFEFARSRALDLLDPLPEDCKILVLDSADADDFARVDWQSSVEKARQRIRGLTVRQSPAPVTRAIDEAFRRFDSLDDPAAEGLPRYVCVFSDRTKGCWQTPSRANRPDQTQLFFFDVGIDAPIDLAITHVELPRGYQGQPRQAFGRGEKIDLRVLVQATGASVAGTLTCQVGARTLRQAFDAEAGKPRMLQFTIDSEAWDLQPGFHQATLVLEAMSDALAFNNQRFMTFEIVQKPRLLVLCDDLKRTEKFARALKSLLYRVEHKLASENSDLSTCDAIFLVGVASPEDKLWQTLSDAVKAGRGLCVIVPGDDLARDAYNSPVAENLLPARLGEKVSVAKGTSWNLGENDLRHPFLRPFLGWMDRGGIDFLLAPRLAYHYWEATPIKGSDSQVVVWYEDAKMSPAVLERRHAKGGNVLLLTTPLDVRTPEWNNYDARLTSFFVALPMLCARHLVAESGEQVSNFEFGGRQPAYSKKAFQVYPKYFLSSGDASEEVHFDTKGRWEGLRLAKAGNYVLSGSSPELAKTEEFFRFSINQPGSESDLSRVAVQEIEASLGPGSVVPQDRHTSLLATIGGHFSEPVELLPWLLIALLFLLALEGLLANRFYRRNDAPPSA